MGAKKLPAKADRAHRGKSNLHRCDLSHLGSFADNHLHKHARWARNNMIFKKNRPDEQSRMIDTGELFDMQQMPFRQFNDIVQNDCPMYMTRAAFRTCIELPGEKRRNALIPANGRWGIVYLSFATTFQNDPNDPHEGKFDVNVLMPPGFQVSKTLKVILDHEFHGEGAFVFMLPDEQWPPAGPVS
jgi:hypothetical protein